MRIARVSAAAAASRPATIAQTSTPLQITALTVKPLTSTTSMYRACAASVVSLVAEDGGELIHLAG
jgi:hypothetical protein